MKKQKISFAAFVLFILVGNHFSANGQVAALRDSLIKYIGKNQLSKAIPFAEERAKLQNQEKGTESTEYASALNTWGDLLQREGRFLEAGPILLNCLAIWRKATNNNDPKLAIPYNTLGLYYLGKGYYSQAEASFVQALNWKSKANPVDSLAVATLYENLGNVHIQTGAYFEAQLNLNRALDMRKRLLSPDHLSVASAQNNLGNFYKILGNFESAGQGYEQALNIFSAKNSVENPTYALYANNLGSLKRAQNKFQAALDWNLLALDIKQKTLPENHPDIAAAYNSLGSVYFDLGRYYRSTQYFRKSLDLLHATVPNDHPDVAELEYNLGFLMLKIRKFKAADSLFSRVEQIRLKKSDPESLLANDLLLQRGILYFEQRKYRRAEKNLIALSKSHQRQVQRYLPFLTSAEKERFAEKLQSGKDIFQSICVERLGENPSLSEALYDHQLATKAILLNSNKNLIKQVRQMKDSLLLAKLTKWETLRSILAKVKIGSFSLAAEEFKKIELEVETLEKELAVATHSLQPQLIGKTVSWKDIQKKLKKGQAAVEMVRIRKWSRSKVVLDTTAPSPTRYAIADLSDTIYYAALVVKKDSKWPEVVLLKNGNGLEGKWLDNYHMHMRLKLDDDSSYSKYWKPLEKQFGKDVFEIYFSPDGVYNSININTLKNPKTGKFLLQEKNIRLITNTRDMLAEKMKRNNSNKAFLMGFPDYNSAFEQHDVAFSALKPQLHTFQLTRGEHFAQLPGTKLEVESISDLLKSDNWQVESYLGNEATEEHLKAIANPKVLHIATHGFFDGSAVKNGNPLLMSGLLLSGANRTLQGEKANPYQEDGILTAFEAMTLNLEQTELVVLSACETGLGEMKNGEGIYGLQRGFKVAGAQNIIMSLWKVDDEATQELMTGFYKSLLAQENKNQVNGVRMAFLNAMLTLKRKYNHPYYWGAFVLVGD